MGIGVIIGTAEAVIGISTGNPALAVEGAERAVRSYLTGELLSPITEPLKEVLGDWVGETCDPDIVENLPYL